MTRMSLETQMQNEELCKSIINFDKSFYTLDSTKSIKGIPADMSINWKTGKVFFTLISEEMKMKLQVLHPSGEFDTIKVAGLGQSTAVDNLNDIVYLATDNGVYKYKDDGTIELYSALGEDVMYIAMTSDGTTMYIATWPQNRVHRITNDGKKQEMFSAIPNGHGLTIDTMSNIYFVATKTTYILKGGYSIPIKIKNLPNDRMTGIFVSRSDEVYAMDENSNLYAIDSDSASARKLGCFGVNGVNTFALDSADNVLIGIKEAILKFRLLEQSPCTATSKSSKKGKRHSKKRKSHTTTTTQETTTTNEEEEEEEE